MALGSAFPLHLSRTISAGGRQSVHRAASRSYVSAPSQFRKNENLPWITLSAVVGVSAAYYFFLRSDKKKTPKPEEGPQVKNQSPIRRETEEVAVAPAEQEVRTSASLE